LLSTKKVLKEKTNKKRYNSTEGIESSEIERRQTSGECLRCAWPAERKGHHWVKDCIRTINLSRGTVGPQGKNRTKKLLASCSEEGIGSMAVDLSTV